ncbi:uncharacterized protein N7479_002056 [Penicillium vulpinum]|uniref:Uncharacterized protein n=1 Tax=Penicillium vulpinum TaxID=29845 RepID=A0A1V6S4X2_9EURO|nr:uncharacterized protein N7479_002056 [Penicillium vulpinum]KAJ5972138.1 hypothetical protein N7479_002056 [Penicillium vulpinum]OQE08906.1 hypothetical protein PENVUL_c008G00708 [Penicillium vulpinum]
MSNFTTVGPFKSSYKFYHKGVESRPAWAYTQARKNIEAQWGEFLKGFPDTASVGFGDYVQGNLGGTIGRMGSWVQLPIIKNPGSETKNVGGADSWKVWFDVEYEIVFYFIDSRVGADPPKGFSTAEVDAAIEKGTNGKVL